MNQSMPNPFPIKQIDTLDINIEGNNGVYSNNYSDIYFQPKIGLQEKQHVFLNGNNLPKNWQAKKVFTIAETGFGTGLNFLNTLKLWRETSNTQQHLHYISCELHPLNKQQLEKVLKQFPKLSEYCQLLCERYPQQLLYGFHRLHFKPLNVTLTLIFAEASDAFEQLNTSIDAWFLDGFAPSKNPGLWSQRLFQAISKLSHIGTTVATYTVARDIRNSLESHGFQIKKTQGFGQKREMLQAVFQSNPKIVEKQPWAQTFKATKQNSITVLGAGIAGLTLADKLQQQGCNFTLIDRQERPCLETSGNPQAMIMPAFDLNDSAESRFYLTAFLYAIRYYSPSYYHAVGVHQLAITAHQKQWQKKFLSSFKLPETIVRFYKGGFFYPQAGWLDTQGHGHSIFNKIDNYLSVEINKIKYHDKLWYLYANDEVVHTTDTLVLTNGIDANRLLKNYELPLIPKHGQISYFKSKGVDGRISECPHVQINKGYITPSWQGQQTIGSTFDFVPETNWYKTPKKNENHWQRNIELWKGTAYVDLLAQIKSHKTRAGIRVTTPDHMPVVGALIDQQKFKQDYHDIHHGKHWKQYPLPVAIDNLYIFTGLGSKGFTSAPILAELLSNQLLGQTQVLDKQMQKSINPNRFLFKQLKLGK